MNALLIGKRDTLQHVISAELIDHGYEVILSPDRAKLPIRDFDLCVDLSAGGIGDVQRIIGSFGKRIAHYILLSDCRVYPSTPRLSPWQTGSIDLCDETGFSTVDRDIRCSRAAERELQHVGARKMVWTIVRPALVESKESPGENNMWWFVSRILDGGPIVLPDGDDPLFRHVSEEDLARAIRVIAGRQEVHFQTLHVTGQALLTFESYARLIMQGLDRKVPVVRIPEFDWQAADLGLPMGRHASSSFIEDSLVLAQMGWQAGDEREWVQEYAMHLVEHPLAEPSARKRELALLDLPDRDVEEPPPPPEPDNWRLVGQPGQPCSFRLECSQEVQKLPAPLLRTRRLTMGFAEEQFLVVPSPAATPRIMGHNVLLELVDPGDSGLEPGSMYLPVARRPCGDEACSFCASHVPGLAGMIDYGFGTKYLSLPSQHLVPVPDRVADTALLADPLASLLAMLPSLLAEKAGPVWIFGERIDALLAMLLVVEADRPLLHVGRTRIATKQLPFSPEQMTLQQAEKKAGERSLVPPVIAVNLSGAIDGENLLAGALAEGGFLVTPFLATKIKQRRVDIHLPNAAPSRVWIERAVEKLETWAPLYDLQSFLHPVPLARYHDLFIAGQFRQPYIETMGGGR